MTIIEWYRRHAAEYGVDVAFERAITELSVHHETAKSQFYRLDHSDDLFPTRYTQVDERVVSSAFDMDDCYEEMPQFFWLDDDGKFHEVSAGIVSDYESDGEVDRFYSQNPTILHSRSGTLIANGCIVGHILYTDH